MGRVGTVIEVCERPEGRGSALRVTDLPEGDVWLAEGYVVEAAEEEEEAKPKARRDRLRREMLGMPPEDAEVVG